MQTPRWRFRAGRLIGQMDVILLDAGTLRHVLAQGGEQGLHVLIDDQCGLTTIQHVSWMIYNG